VIVLTGDKNAQRNVNQTIDQILSRRFNRNANEPIIEKLTERVENDAAGALAGLTDEIRKVIMTSESFTEMSERLLQLKLQPAELAKALAQGMALSHLIGQAALLDEIQKTK